MDVNPVDDALDVAALPIGHVADLALAGAEVFLLWKAVQSWSKFIADVNAPPIQKLIICDDTKIPHFGPVSIDAVQYCTENMKYTKDDWTFTPICDDYRTRIGERPFIKGWRASNGRCSFPLGSNGGGRFAVTQ
jgi:hypothetical protein